MIRLGLVGYGAVARAHAVATSIVAKDSPRFGVRLMRIAGPDHSKARDFAAEFEIPSSGHVDELLADPGIDAVILASPSGLHTEQTAAALGAGKHVLCEIPLALSLAEVQQLRITAEAAQRCLMVCHTNRFQPAVVDIRDRIEAGSFRPYAVFVRYLLMARENVGQTGRARTWTDNLLWHHGCHAVDTALWILGADGGTVGVQGTRNGRNGLPIDIALSVVTPSGALVSAALSYDSHVSVFDFVIVGEEATHVVDLRTLVKQAQLHEMRLAHPIVLQLCEFLGAITAGREPSVSPRRIAGAMAVLDAAQRQLQTP